MSYFMQTAADLKHDLSHYKVELKQGGFKLPVRQIGRGCRPDISVSTQAPSSCGVRVCIETEMSYSMQTVADQMHVLSHYKFETKPHGRADV
jgi:hypothetical protein